MAAVPGVSAGQTPTVAQPAPLTPAPGPTAPVLDLPATICGQTVGVPSRLPAPGGPFLTAVMLCFEKQGGSPVVEANTYLYYLQQIGRAHV